MVWFSTKKKKKTLREKILFQWILSFFSHWKFWNWKFSTKKETKTPPPRWQRSKMIMMMIKQSTRKKKNHKMIIISKYGLKKSFKEPAKFFVEKIKNRTDETERQKWRNEMKRTRKREKLLLKNFIIHKDQNREEEKEMKTFWFLGEKKLEIEIFFYFFSVEKKREIIPVITITACTYLSLGFRMKNKLGKWVMQHTHTVCAYSNSQILNFFFEFSKFWFHMKTKQSETMIFLAKPKSISSSLARSSRNRW